MLYRHCIIYSCVACPGHSEGSIVYHVERKNEEPLLITGDVLFSNSVGRTEYFLSFFISFFLVGLVFQFLKVLQVIKIYVNQSNH